MELTKWKIRPVLFEDLEKQGYELERRIVPVQSPMWIGAMNKYVNCPRRDWDFQALLNLPKKSGDFLYDKLMGKKPELEDLIESPRSLLVVNREKFKQINKFHCSLEIVAGNLYILDFGSKNKVWIDGEKIESKTGLCDEDIFWLGGIKDKGGLQFKVYDKIKGIHALLVGTDYKEDWRCEKKIDKQIMGLDSYFKKLGVSYTSEILLHDNATYGKTKSALLKARNLPKDFVFVFFYNGHGGYYEITTKKYNKNISKYELSDWLNQIKSKKIIIIDACHSGSGWSSLDKNSCLCFFSSESSEESDWDTFSNYFLESLNGMLSKNEILDLKQVDMDYIRRMTKKKGRFKQTPTIEGLKSIVF